MTVVRGGYGIYYSQPRSGATGVAPYGSQGFNQYTSAITRTTATAPRLICI